MKDLGKRRQRFRTILADPPWQFDNRTGKVAPEHQRLRRYATMTLSEIANLGLELAPLVEEPAHLYLWTPNSLLPDALHVMKSWGFAYVSNLVWYKVRGDGGPDGRGCGFWFRNVTELVLFGTKGAKRKGVLLPGARTLAPARRQVNLIATRKREHSRKPDELYSLIESCSPGPYLELFARHRRRGWAQWGDQL